MITDYKSWEKLNEEKDLDIAHFAHDLGCSVSNGKIHINNDRDVIKITVKPHNANLVEIGSKSRHFNSVGLKKFISNLSYSDIKYIEIDLDKYDRNRNLYLFKGLGKEVNDIAINAHDISDWMYKKIEKLYLIHVAHESIKTNLLSNNKINVNKQYIKKCQPHNQRRLPSQKDIL